jgi:hypothetical protein
MRSKPWFLFGTSRRLYATFAAVVLMLAIPAKARAGDPIKDIIIYQPGGWSGLIRDSDKNIELEWPKEGGRSAYLSRNPGLLLHQMKLIAELGKHVAIGVLLMTDSDASRSGYGTCWNGSWGGKADVCERGEFIRPLEMYDHIRSAARAFDLRYVPDFSLMNYDGVRGAGMLGKLKSAIAWWRKRLPDSLAAKSATGRYYVIIDGLPKLDEFSPSNKAELFSYMQSQQDIDWIDNLVDVDDNPSAYSDASNIFRSAAAEDDVQRFFNARLGARYLWWFTLNRVVRDPADATLDINKIPEDVRMRQLNINPHDPLKYPVIISQWNEYGEGLVIEPTTKSPALNYEYLRAKLALQP